MPPRSSLLVNLLAALVTLGLAPHAVVAQEKDAEVAPAAYTEPSANVEMIRQLARQRGGQPAALAQIIQLARDLNDAAAAELIDELAAAHLRAGNLNLAAESRTFIAERFPNEPLGRNSIFWLVRLYASSEVAHARRSESQGAADIRRQLAPSVASALKSAPDTIAKGSGASSSTRPKRDDQHAIYALHLATQAMSKHAALADDSALAFQRAVAARRAGQERASQAFLSPLNHRAKDDPWGQAARAEAWLQESPQDAAPKSTVPCVAAEKPPHLDGLLDDPCWNPQQASRGARSAVFDPEALARRELAASPAPSPNNATPAATVRWAYDRDYLYIAAHCQKLANVDYADDRRPRPHDGNVDAHDRVRLLIDVDRDYASWFELVVDSRGWTADGCWGDAAWNPTWYVARGDSAADDAWTIEAAIPLKQLSAAPTGAGAAWACSVERLPPTNERSESPVSTTRDPGPSVFSLLLFE